MIGAARAKVDLRRKRDHNLRHDTDLRPARRGERWLPRSIGRGAFALRPYPITERDEIGAGLRQRADLVEACGIADAGQLEQVPPTTSSRSCIVVEGRRRPCRSRRSEGSPNIT